MDFSWSTEYLNYRKSVESFVRQKINPRIAQLTTGQQFPLPLWKACAEFGIQGLSTPLEYGGPLADVDFLRAILAMEGFGYACKDNGLPFALNAQMWSVQTAIVHFGSDAQKQKYLPSMVNGDIIGAHAMAEPDAGSDAFNIQCTAEKQADGSYILNGKKHWIALGPICDMALVYANSRPQLGKWGISIFLVDANQSGFTKGPAIQTMGLNSVPIGALHFDNCRIPADSLLGKEGAGFSIMNHNLEYDRCSILAGQLGAMERQLEDSIAFANERVQFGQSIGKFQSVSNRIADMKVRLETARLLLYRTAWKKQQGQPALLDAAMLKLQLSESFFASSMDAMRTMGGKSYGSDTIGPERDVRDAIGGLMYVGTSDIQRNIIAKLLGL